MPARPCELSWGDYPTKAKTMMCLFEKRGMDFVHCDRHHTTSERKNVEADSSAMDGILCQEDANRSVRGLRYKICLLLDPQCKNEAATKEDDNVGGIDE